MASTPRMLCGLLGGREKRGQETAVPWTAREPALAQPAVLGSPAARQVQLCHLGWDAQRAVPCSSSHRVVRLGGNGAKCAGCTFSVKVQGLSCSQEVALGFESSQMYILIRNFILVFMNFQPNADTHLKTPRPLLADK